MKQKEFISYVVVGVLTTAINYSIYFAILFFTHNTWFLANCISWIGAVIFAYYANRTIVFKSTNDKQKEMVSFFMLRLLTLGIETVCLYTLIQWIGWNPSLSKIMVSFITIIGNYLLCKTKIFNSERSYAV